MILSPVANFLRYSKSETEEGSHKHDLNYITLSVDISAGVSQIDFHLQCWPFTTKINKSHNPMLLCEFIRLHLLFSLFIARYLAGDITN